MSRDTMNRLLELRIERLQREIALLEERKAPERREFVRIAPAS